MVSGGWDPVHKGHIELIEKASKFGDVCVILNHDEWLTKKKGKPFMEFAERRFIMEHIKGVRHVIAQLDDDTTVCKTIKYIVETARKHFTKGGHIYNSQMMPYDAFLFGNGGDRAKLNTPEVDTCIELGVGLVWGLGDKIQSSSELIKQAKQEQ